MPGRIPRPGARLPLMAADPTNRLPRRAAEAHEIAPGWGSQSHHDLAKTSSRESGSPVQLCLDTTVAQAESAIMNGQVRRVDVLIDEERPVEGLTAIQLELQDGECSKLPEGADNRASLLQVLGLIELYNQEGDGN